MSTCPVEVEPDEARWGHLRNAATPAPGKGEKEYMSNAEYFYAVARLTETTNRGIL